MHFIQEIHEDVYWVGVNDRRLQRFENMFPLKNGVAYNSYLIKDDKNTLMDCVDSTRVQQFLENVSAALDGEDLDYVVVQHMEPDHCGTINFILDKYPNCKFVGNKKTFMLYEQFYDDSFKDRYFEIKDKDILEIGKHKLQFYFAPMVHWPEVFMTYEITQSLFFSADAFGAFDVHEGSLYSGKYVMDDFWMNEARRYYINIVGKHGKMVMNLFNKIKDLQIKVILPLHGPVYNDPKSIEIMLDKYKTWASFESEEKGVVIAFCSMYGNMELAADILANEISKLGVTKIKMHDVSQTHASYIISDCHRYSNAVFTPINYNAVLYYEMDALLRELTGTGYKNKHISFLNGWSWGGNSQKIAEEILNNANHEFIGEVVKIQSSMKEEDYEHIKQLAREIADDLNN